MAGSGLAKQILGTNEGLAGTTALQIDQELVPAFDLLVIWLALGDDHLAVKLSEDNASQLISLTSYFGLEELEQVILREQEKREAVAKLEKRIQDIYALLVTEST